MINYYVSVLKNYVNFNGRARRSEFWYFFLINFIISTILTYGVAPLMHSLILANIYSLAVLVPSIAVAIRRMHDINKSGWFILIPIYNIVLAATEGDKGDNQYGPDPKANV